MEQHYLVSGRIITLLISCPSQRSLFATQCTLTALGRNHFSSAHSACAVLRWSMWSRIQTVAPKRGQQWGLLGRKLVWLCANASLEREIETFFHFSKIARKWLTSWLSLVYLGMAPYFLTSLPRGEATRMWRFSRTLAYFTWFPWPWGNLGTTRVFFYGPLAKQQTKQENKNGETQTTDASILAVIQPSPWAFSARSILYFSVSCDVTESHPLSSQNSRGQRDKRERLGTRLAAL